MSRLEQHQIINIDDTNLSQVTKNDYNFKLNQFFKFSNIKSIGQLIKTPTVSLESELVFYTKHLINRVRNNELSANTVPKQFKGIKYLLDVNYRENDVRWKSIKALFPTKVKLSGYKAWTTEQIQEMEKYTKTTRNLAFLHFMASLGGRIGIHENPLLMKHLIPMSSTNSTTDLDCCAILLYADEYESAKEKDLDDSIDEVQSGDSYWAFLTPEATSYLKKYHDQRKRNGEIFAENTPIFRTQYQVKYVNDDVTQLSRNGAISMMVRILASTSINRNKKGRRFDVQLDHGFRKRFNTIMKLESNVNSNIVEKMLGHRNGLDGVYFTPTRQQCFAEFVKAIPQLTVSSVERQKQEIEAQKQQIDELELERTKVHQLTKDMSVVKASNNQLSKNISVVEKKNLDLEQNLNDGATLSKESEITTMSLLKQLLNKTITLENEIKELKKKR